MEVAGCPGLTVCFSSFVTDVTQKHETSMFFSEFVRVSVSIIQFTKYKAQFCDIL